MRDAGAAGDARRSSCEFLDRTRAVERTRDLAGAPDGLLASFEDVRRCDGGAGYFAHRGEHCQFWTLSPAPDGVDALGPTRLGQYP